MNLNNNKLTEFPDNYNNIFLPKEITKSLEVLFLYNNKISEISKNICNLVNLKILDLSENIISSLPKEISKCKKLKYLDLRKNKIIGLSKINIFELKCKMGKRLLIDDIDYKKINEIYFQLDKKSVRFNYVKLRNCKPSPVPSIIYSEQKLIKIINDWKENFSKYCRPNNKIDILDPNEFTFEVKSFDTTILINYIYHLYNPKDKYLKWNVPINLLDDFKKYIGAIVFKLFSSDDLMFVEGHLNSLFTVICYCPERHKNEMIYLYELLINEDKNFIEKSQQKTQI
ncbi:leucine-rich repeat protein soc-2-like protein [Vairimorpha apis BRL 01]|uniref:Leucine-rich repeat protein soc-2-like protein n=1 Tax=Vairimorpha apis BRL 01 TaxID=1037528 RepID=T0MFC6_9MICR|nr:leucine-rich repeat protein soc-2-like protein [Vairimorpha apis BRL 01]